MITSASVESATRMDSRTPPRNPRFRVAAVVATALVVIASISCSSPYRRPQLTPPENGFSGIADGLSNKHLILFNRIDKDYKHKHWRLGWLVKGLLS
jgi:hypothetical protein